MKSLKSQFAHVATKYRQSVIVRASLLALALITTSVQAEDGVRWFSFKFPDFEKNSFDIDDTATIKAFASEHGNYDVTLIDEKSRMVRLDTATEQHWEILPMSFDDRKPSTNVPFFQLSNNEPPTSYLGRIYYPRGGDPVTTNIGQQRVTVNRATPYPVKGGFRGVLANSHRGNKLVYRFQTGRKFETGTAYAVNLGAYQSEGKSQASLSRANGSFAPYYSLSVRADQFWLLEGYSRGDRVACWPLDGRSLFEYPVDDSAHSWDRIAAVAVPVQKKSSLCVRKA